MAKRKILALGLVAVWLISAALAGGCVPADETGEGNPWSMFIFLGLLVVAIYFLMIRPQRKRQKEHNELMAELRKGDNVITAGGIYGHIESLTEESAVLKVESGATLRIAKKSIVTKQGG